MANTLITKTKRSAQALLTKLGLYYRLKQSVLYDLYWRVADNTLLKERDMEVSFYRNVLKALRKGDVIFDIGANCGQKTDIFLRLGATVIAVEPDEKNQTVLKQRFVSCRLIKQRVTIIGKAAGAVSQRELMWIDEPGSAKNTLSSKWVDTLRSDQSRFGRNLDFGRQMFVETTTLDELIAKFGLPYFIKIDVEGYEPTVLAGLSRAVPYLSFEVNLPEFLPEGVQCVETLIHLAPGGRFNYVSDCRVGLASEQWLEGREFLQALNARNEKSIEVIWKSA